MKLEIVEKHKIVPVGQHGTGSLELLLLKKSNRSRPTYRLAVAFERQGELQMRYLRGYPEQARFPFGWTSEQSEARRYYEDVARFVMGDILKNGTISYGFFDWR